MLRFRGLEITLSVIQQFSWLALSQPPGYVVPPGKEKGPLTGPCTLQGTAGVLPACRDPPASGSLVSREVGSVLVNGLRSAYSLAALLLLPVHFF